MRVIRAGKPTSAVVDLSGDPVLSAQERFDGIHVSRDLRLLIWGLAVGVVRSCAHALDEHVKRSAEEDDMLEVTIEETWFSTVPDTITSGFESRIRCMRCSSRVPSGTSQPS